MEPADQRSTLRSGGNEVWFISQDNGLQIVRLTDRFRAAGRELFAPR
jgi:hypothetical protein